METGIRQAGERDLPALTAIWKECFHDPEDYIRLFYHENFGSIAAAVYTVDGRPVSMLHWMDAVFASAEGDLDARFLYAGGTLSTYRKKGYYSALFRFVKDYADRNGVALFGKPASRDLVPYYRSLGFEPDACFRRVALRPGENIPLSVSPVSPEQYNRLRDRAFSSHPYARWPDRHVRWAFADNAYFGGRALAVTLDGETHFLLGVPQGNTLLITETDLSLPQLKRACGALCAVFGADVLQACLPDYACEEGEEIISSIVYHAPLRNTYVNLSLF